MIDMVQRLSRAAAAASPRRIAVVAVATAALAACATPETRVRGALIDAGLPRPVADCMAGRLVDRLSLQQLRRIERVGSLRGERIGDLTVREFLRRAEGLGDPEVLRVMTTAGIGCAIAS